MNWLEKWLKKLADANEKNFGGQAPDCCAGMKHQPKTETQSPKQVKTGEHN